MNIKTCLAAMLLAAGATTAAVAGPIPYANTGVVNGDTYTFTANGGDVTAYFLGSTASYDERLGLLIGGVDFGTLGLQNHSTAVGAAWDFGTIAAGTVLTFYIKVDTTGDKFYSNAALNADGINHVYSTAYPGGDAPAGTYVAFEDVYGGGDLNYHDETFTFSNVAATPAVPEPANVALLVAGLGLMGVMARRRQS